MRFKAKLASEQISLLYNLVSPLSRVVGEGNNNAASAQGGGTCIVYLDSNYVRICAKGKSLSDLDGISCFTELKTHDGIFLEHRIESMADNNVIVMELELVQLKVALQSIVAANDKDGNTTFMADTSTTSTGTRKRKSAGTSASAMSYRITVFKLAKRNGMPCLCFDSHATPGGGMEVHHAIPVRIMKATEAQFHLPPQINMPDVQLELPLDRPLRTIVERLRSISPQVYLEGSMKGELTIRVDTDGASIRTFLNNLIPKHDEEEDEDENNGHANPKSCVIKVDTKKLCACLQWQQTALLQGQITSALICLVENEMLVLHISLNPPSVGFFTYYVPVHYLSDDNNNIDNNAAPILTQEDE